MAASTQTAAVVGRNRRGSGGKAAAGWRVAAPGPARLGLD